MLAAADMDEAPVEIGGQQRQRLEQHVIALLLDRAADAEDDDRIGGIAAVARRALAVEMAEAGEIEAVIAQMHARPVARRGVADGRSPVLVQVTVQRALAELARAAPSPATSRCPWHAPSSSRAMPVMMLA